MQIQGKSVFQGIAIGQVKVLKKKKIDISRTSVPDVIAELQRFAEARKSAAEQLGKLYDKAISTVGDETAAIFEVHQMMLDDPNYVEAIVAIIENESVNAEYAVEQAGNNLAAMFEAMDDEYMSARAADVRDISKRLVGILCGQEEGELVLDEPAIILADDLTPSETVLLDKSKILAIVTRRGSVNSHTAILARTMGIPALVSTDCPLDSDGKMAIVDGNEGIMILNPEKSECDQYQHLLSIEAKEKDELTDLIGKEDKTLDGKHIKLYANIGESQDVEAVIANDAAGIGLFRSEFLYLQRSDLPSEEELFAEYKRVAEAMGDKKVIIRTMDIGADKQVDYLGLTQEENPAMGYRAIRICLNQPALFKTQLRAIYRASAYGNLAIMFPMIISLEEINAIKQLMDEVKEELTSEEIPYTELESGIMIETPAAVMMSDVFAKEVDFFSIGTNDLTQYTLAVDRQNEKLTHLYDSHHPAVLRMIKMVIDNGHREGCWVGICGELGADLSLTEELIKMGVDELSVAPSMVLKVRDKIRKTTCK